MRPAIALACGALARQHGALRASMTRSVAVGRQLDGEVQGSDVRERERDRFVLIVENEERLSICRSSCDQLPFPCRAVFMKSISMSSSIVTMRAGPPQRRECAATTRRP